METPDSWQLGCEAPTLCPGDGTLTFFIDGEVSAPTSVETDDLERARCMVAALAERRFGQFDFFPVQSVLIDVLSLEIVGDTAVVRSKPGGCVELFPSCGSREELRPLREPAFFVNCVAGDALAVYTCLLDPFQADRMCLPGPLDCPS